MRVKVTLACTECKRRNYVTKKNKRNNPERIEMKLSNSLFYYKELLRVMCVNCVMCVTFFDDPLDCGF